MNRRQWFQSMGISTAAAAVGLPAFRAEAQAVSDRVKRSSEPSRLEITDMRMVRMGPDGWKRYVIRLDTNQGVCGYGEVRDGASPTFALMLKSRILGENPAISTRYFANKAIRRACAPSGRVVAIEMLCGDLAGKAWGVPCWQMLEESFEINTPIRRYALLEQWRGNGQASQGAHRRRFYLSQNGHRHRYA